jgi:hypothetical protein
MNTSWLAASWSGLDFIGFRFVCDRGQWQDPVDESQIDSWRNEYTFFAMHVIDINLVCKQQHDYTPSRKQPWALTVQILVVDGHTQS